MAIGSFWRCRRGGEGYPPRNTEVICGPPDKSPILVDSLVRNIKIFGRAAITLCKVPDKPLGPFATSHAAGPNSMQELLFKLHIV